MALGSILVLRLGVFLSNGRLSINVPLVLRLILYPSVSFLFYNCSLHGFVPYALELFVLVSLCRHLILIRVCSFLFRKFVHIIRYWCSLIISYIRNTSVSMRHFILFYFIFVKLLNTSHSSPPPSSLSPPQPALFADHLHPNPHCSPKFGLYRFFNIFLQNPYLLTWRIWGGNIRTLPIFQHFFSKSLSFNMADLGVHFSHIHTTSVARTFVTRFCSVPGCDTDENTLNPRKVDSNELS